MVIVPGSVPVVGLPTVVMVTLVVPNPPTPVMVDQPSVDADPVGVNGLAEILLSVAAVMVRFVGSKSRIPV